MENELERRRLQAATDQVVSEPKAMKTSVKLTQADTVLNNPLGSRAAALQPCSWCHFNNRVINQAPLGCSIPQQNKVAVARDKDDIHLPRGFSESISKQQVALAILDTYFFF